MGTRGGGLVARKFLHSLSPRASASPASLLNRKNHADQLRTLSRAVETEDVESLDQETERKAGWVFKAIAVATFTYMGLNVYPLMGDSFVKQSVSLVRAKDPFLRRSGASRLTSIATDDERRRKIVDAGGLRALVNMLQSASDDDTRREAVRALATLSECDAVVEALDNTSVQSFMGTLSTSSSDSETQQYALLFVERLERWKSKSIE